MYLYLQEVFSKIIFQYDGLTLIPEINTNLDVLNGTSYILSHFLISHLIWRSHCPNNYGSQVYFHILKKIWRLQDFKKQYSISVSKWNGNFLIILL